MHDPQVLIRDTGFELALSTRVSSSQLLNQRMDDNSDDDLGDDISRGLNSKGAVLFILLISRRPS